MQDTSLMGPGQIVYGTQHRARAPGPWIRLRMVLQMEDSVGLKSQNSPNLATRRRRLRVNVKSGNDEITLPLILFHDAKMAAFLLKMFLLKWQPTYSELINFTSSKVIVMECIQHK